MIAMADHGAGDSEVSHCASMAANFIGWSTWATWAARWPVVAEKTVPTAAKTRAIRSARPKTSTLCLRSRW